jgi:hypothetical protein
VIEGFTAKNNSLVFMEIDPIGIDMFQECAEQPGKLFLFSSRVAAPMGAEGAAGHFIVIENWIDNQLELLDPLLFIVRCFELWIAQDRKSAIGSRFDQL